MATHRIVSLTSTGPDGIVVEVQLSGPAGASPVALHGRLAAAVSHAVAAYETGAAVDVALGDAWLSARVLD